MIDLSRALRYSFAGPDGFVKTVIGALLALLMPLFFLSGFVLLGYQLRIIRDVMDGRDDALPDWDNLPGDFVNGIVVFVGTLLYYVPAFVLVGLAARLGLDAISGYKFDLMAPALPTLDRGALAMILVCFTLALIWLLLSAPLVMAAIARYAETGRFLTLLDVLNLADEVWEQRGAAGALMFNLFLLTVLSQVASMVVSATCLLSTYVQFINFAAACHLTGQWGAHLKQHRPKPSVIRPLAPLR